MLMKTKRKLTYISIAFSYLLTGIQYAIIFPSLNLFITTRYDASPTMLGVIIAAYSISGIFSGPIFGYIVDKKRNSKTVVFVANIANIIGNVMYMLGVSPMFLVFSRLICGIGSGAVSAMFADITRSSSESELTSIIAIMMVFQEVGLLFAPVFAIVLKNIHFYIGPFLIDKFTSPGLVMAILYGLLQLMIPFMYFNLSYLYEQKCIEESVCYEEKDEHAVTNDTTSIKNDDASVVSSNIRSVNDSLNNYYSSDTHSVLSHANDSFPGNSKTAPSKYNEAISTVKNSVPEDKCSELANASMSTEMIESAERYITSMSETESVSSVSDTSNYHYHSSTELYKPHSRFNSNCAIIPTTLSDEGMIRRISSDESQIKFNVINFKDEYLRDEIIVLLGLQFISAFSQTTLETIITPLSKRLYNWSDVENAGFFLAAAILILAVFVIIRLVNRWISDRYLILFGLISMIISYVWLISFFVPNAKPDSLKSLPYFVVGAVFDLIGLPVLMVCSPSLFSKLTKKETQAYSQGIRRSCLFVGLIFGPVWGGSTVHKMYLLFSLPLAVLLLIFVLFLMSFKKIKVSSQKSETNVQNLPQSQATEIPT